MFEYLRAFAGHLFPSYPAVFKSDFSLAESVSRLRSCTRRNALSSLFAESAAGPVTESRVRLQRIVPMFGNSFKPVFIGAFDQEEGRVFLRGRFTLFAATKIFMAMWFSFVAVWTTLACYTVVCAVAKGDEGFVLAFPLVGVTFFVVGVAFVRGGWWLSRHDIPYLEATIEGALKRGDNPGFGTRSVQPSVPPNESRPGFPVRWTAVVVFVTVWNLLLALDGFVPWREPKPPGPFVLLALGTAFVGALVLRRSPIVQRLVMKPGRSVNEIAHALILLQVIFGFLLIGFGLFSVLGRPGPLSRLPDCCAYEQEKIGRNSSQSRSRPFR